MRSRFIDELPAEHVEIAAEIGLHPGGGVWGGDWDARSRNVIDLPFAPQARRPILVASAPVPAPRRGEEVRKTGGFSVGERVFHQKFGYGRVTEVWDNRLAIRFDAAGDKKIMDAYVERA
jgi:DNA helicase-2/ATP-dependent DNA helicase PcrA